MLATLTYSYVYYEAKPPWTIKQHKKKKKKNMSCMLSSKLAQDSCLPHLKFTFVIHRGASAAGT